VIFCANHASHLDGIALTLAIKKRLKHNFVALTAEDYFDKFNLITLLGDLVPFDRTGNEYALWKNLKYIELCQRVKKSFVLFPEGTRSLNGKLQEFKWGAAWLAEKTGLKIIPVFINRAHQLMPPGRIFPMPGKLSVTFGEPLNMQTLTSNETDNLRRYQSFTQKLRAAIVKLSK
jgi:1-acyl-sn-glycerol-3-phosphate acyltransferase